MEKEGAKILEQLIVPIIIILAIGLAFLLLVKKKIINLLTGLSVTNTTSPSTNIIILICVIAIVAFLFYKYKR